MDKLSINTLEGWNRLDEYDMPLHLQKKGIEPTPEAIQREYDEINERCNQLALEAQAEKDKLKAIAEEAKEFFMHSSPNEMPFKELEAICRTVNRMVGTYSNEATHWNMGAIYLHGKIQGKREERSRRAKQSTLYQLEKQHK